MTEPAWENVLNNMSLESTSWEIGKFKVVKAKSAEENPCKGIKKLKDNGNCFRNGVSFLSIRKS